MTLFLLSTLLSADDFIHFVLVSHPDPFFPRRHVFIYYLFMICLFIISLCFLFYISYLLVIIYLFLCICYLFIIYSFCFRLPTPIPPSFQCCRESRRGFCFSPTARHWHNNIEMRGKGCGDGECLLTVRRTTWRPRGHPKMHSRFFLLRMDSVSKHFVISSGTQCSRFHGDGWAWIRGGGSHAVVTKVAQLKQDGWKWAVREIASVFAVGSQ